MLSQYCSVWDLFSNTQVITLYFCSPVVQIPGAEKDSTLTVTIRVYGVERFTPVQIKGTLITQDKYLKNK